jgi:hypothetical protein
MPMTPIAIAYLVTVVASTAMLLASWRWPRAGRLLYAALFLGAGIFNAVTAVRTPQVYVTGFAPHAFPPMREFIERVVALAPDAIVLTIATCQVFVAIALALGRGALFWAGVAGAACFLVGISWLGVGAGFPMNLVLAAGVVLLPRAPPRR